MKTVTYTVDIVNNGQGPAYDVQIQDVLPEGLREGGITTQSITLLSSGASLPVVAPSYDPATGTRPVGSGWRGPMPGPFPPVTTLRLVYTATR